METERQESPGHPTVDDIMEMFGFVQKDYNRAQEAYEQGDLLRLCQRARMLSVMAKALADFMEEGFQRGWFE